MQNGLKTGLILYIMGYLVEFENIKAIYLLMFDIITAYQHSQY